MSELNLDKAVDAAEDSHPDWPWWMSGEAAIRAALPHIMEALATLAEDEAAQMVPESTPFRVHTDAAEWLRTVAERFRA